LATVPAAPASRSTATAATASLNPLDILKPPQLVLRRSYRQRCAETYLTSCAAGGIHSDRRSRSARTQLCDLTIARPAALRTVIDFARMLRAIGLRPRVITKPDGTAYDSLLTNPHAGIQAGWINSFADRPDPAEFFDPLFTCPTPAQPPQATGNFARYCDATTDAAITKAEASENGNPTAAAAAWATVDARVTRSAAWVPYANARLLDVTSARATGYAYNPIYSILLDEMSVR
jgi:hypothetical protein